MTKDDSDRIVTLPREVVERIAAGEVIERPASALRELIENALDAGASTIRVELRGGGLRLIRVYDNGRGIPPADLPLAGLAHTTSKLHSLADLDDVTTLGFRGEALASITTVAELEIASAADGGGVAHVRSWYLDGTSHSTTVARARGTTVTARGLFQAMPARLALLGSARAEGAKSQVLLRAYALAYPDVAFTLISEGQVALQTPGTNVEDAVASLYGADLANALLPFSATMMPDSPLTISGVISSRGFHQPGRDLVIVLVNNRMLSSRVLLAALESGYRSLLPKGHHPLLVARVRLPPEQVDVNVHPAKTEVLLQGEEQIVAALRTSIHQALGASPVSAASATLYGLSPRSAVQLPLPSPRKRRGLRTSFKAAPTARGAEEEALDGPVPALEPLAQFDEALILTRSPEGDLFLVDQHRAHERILYERLLYQRDNRFRDEGSLDVASESSAGQLLLEPLLIELTPAQAASLSLRITELAGLGLVCQPFGGSVFLVRSVPALPGAAGLPADLASALGAAASAGEDWISRVSVALACQSAIRRGQVLSKPEQVALLRDLRQVATPAVCPHGSPLLLRYSRQYLTRAFEW